MTQEAQGTIQKVFNPIEGIELAEGALAPINSVLEDRDHGIFLYHGDCLEILDQVAEKYSDGCFDMIFADPPYFLSNGGITCHAGKMVKVDKGDGISHAELRRTTILIGNG